MISSSQLSVENPVASSLERTTDSSVIKGFDSPQFKKKNRISLDNLPAYGHICKFLTPLDHFTHAVSQRYSFYKFLRRILTYLWKNQGQIDGYPSQAWVGIFAVNGVFGQERHAQKLLKRQKI